MNVCCLKDAPGRCWGWWFSLSSYSPLKSLSPVPLNPGFWHSNELPTPDSRFPDGQKVKAHLSLFPWYHGDPCKWGGGRQTKKTRGGTEWKEEKERGGEGLGARKAKGHNELTLGMLSLVQTPSDNNLSRISQAKMDGHSRLYWAILLTTSGVATLGLLPPIALGLMEPVS